jgi:hypothetical protein
MLLSSLSGSSKRPPQGSRKEPRAGTNGPAATEGADAEDDIDSDEEKRLRATDLGMFPSTFALKFRSDSFYSDSITARPFADDVIM